MTLTEAGLAGIIQSVSDAIITIDEAQNIVLFNRAAEEIFRCDRRDALGRPIDDFIPERFRPAHRHYVDRYREGGEAVRHMRGLRELTAVRADGEEFPIEASISRADADGCTYLTVALRDVSEHRALERTRREKEAAEAASAAKTQFLSVMSHELRTPLTAVIGLAQMLTRDARHPLHETQRGHLGHIESAGKHLLSMIDGMLDISRIELDLLDLHLEPIVVAPLLDESVGMVEALALKRDVRVMVDLGEHADVQVRADRTRLVQVYVNLLNNAVKYNRPGGSVHVRLDRANGAAVRVSVRDTGIGIPQDRLHRLFEPFERLGRERSGIDGLGVGLALSRGLVERMGGSIEVSSATDQGTEFSVTLPRAA